MDKDLLVISGDFFDHPLPKEKKYLFKYFRLKQDRQIVRYYLLFDGDLRRFVDHTGVFFTPRWIKIMKRQIKTLESAYEKARKEGDFEQIALLESGKWDKLSQQYVKKRFRTGG